MVNIEGYKTSKDYSHLRELLDQGKTVVCFTTYNFNRWHPDQEPMMTTDICVGKLLNGDSPEYKHYSFSARGIGYGDYWPMDDKFTFEELCEAKNIEYIEPNETKEEPDDFWAKCNKCEFFDGYDICMRRGNFGTVTDSIKSNCEKKNLFEEKCEKE